MNINGPDQKNHKTRRAFLKNTAASVAGLVIAPLSYTQAGDNTDYFAEIDSMTSKMLGAGLSLTSSASSACSAIAFAGDINEDCRVDIEDLRLMARDWLTSSADSIANLDSAYSYIPGSAGSHIYVDFGDFSVLANDWGKCNGPDSACGQV